MVRPSPSRLLLRAVVATCTLAWVSAACGSNASSTVTSPSGDDGGAGDAGANPGGDGASGPGPVDGSADSRAADDASGASDSGRKDGEPTPPPAPACKTGDRKEWSGPVGSTGIAVAVCSVCGASYVVASNGSGSSGQVTVDNGSKTITVAVAAGAMATSANLADDPTDGTVTVCATGSSHACLPSSPPNQRYCNPYRDLTNLVPERIDQGVDYGGAGPIYAMGPGTIDVFNNRNDAGWPGGTFVSYVLSVGPAAGKEIYLAENIDLSPGLQSGSFVYSGTVIGTLVDASPDSESGWGVSGESV
ncbi:MAG TPA: hypothetical protein VMI75_31685, partial [Polyangiaceae bacterium]|nr:hypothetical protein [Polyangiaceae bacterium]